MKLADVCMPGECGPVDLPCETPGAQDKVLALPVTSPGPLGALSGCIFCLNACSALKLLHLCFKVHS